jgi:hypothetical protein
MMAEEIKHPATRRNVIGATLARLVGKDRIQRRPRLSALGKMSLLHRFASRQAVVTPDPVSLAVFAIERVGPAAVRACASGIEVQVAVPDEATAAVFRAALAETARRRGTDRLIRLVVD